MGVPYAEVIGDPIAHSKSPLIHKFWLEKLGIEGNYRVNRVQPPGLGAYLSGRRSDPHWRGCNVTAPHKQAIIPFLDSLSAEAGTFGAANVVVPCDARLTGHNSDARGFLEPLLPWPRSPKHSQYQSRSALVFGTGGAARAVAHALTEYDFMVTVLGRRPEQARRLIRELGGGCVQPWTHYAEPTDYVRPEARDEVILLVNATTVGMTGSDRLPFDWSWLPAAAIVYDLVYDPPDTPLLKAARRRGYRTIGGLDMLIGQAAIAFALFFGQPAPRQHDTELRGLLAA